MCQHDLGRVAIGKRVSPKGVHATEHLRVLCMCVPWRAWASRACLRVPFGAVRSPHIRHRRRFRQDKNMQVLRQGPVQARTGREPHIFAPVSGGAVRQVVARRREKLVRPWPGRGAPAAPGPRAHCCMAAQSSGKRPIMEFCIPAQCGSAGGARPRKRLASRRR